MNYRTLTTAGFLAPKQVYSKKLRSIVIATTLLGLFLTSPSQASQTTSSFDVVAFKWDSGESATNVPTGVRCQPAPVNEGAVNLMHFFDSQPLYLTDGPNGEAVVAFGFVDRTIWTPSHFDGYDLTSEFAPIGDRVYATVDSNGKVTLMGAANNGVPFAVADSTIALDPNLPFRLAVEQDFGWVYVFLGDDVIVEGNPFFGASAPDYDNIGNDMVVSVTCLCDGSPSLADVTINDLARDPTLEVHEFPQVFMQLPPEGTNLRPVRPFPMALRQEEIDLAITITNVGSTAATGIQVTLGLPPGTDMAFVGPSTLDYGDLDPETSTVRRFAITTGNTDVGTYALSLDFTSSGGSQSLETFLPVWSDSVVINDLATGDGWVTMESPYNVLTGTVIAPEVFDAQGLPDYFDLQRLTFRVDHKVPFPGIHWGDVEELEPPAPAPLSASFAKRGSGTVIGSMRLLTPTPIALPGVVLKLVDFNSGAVVAQDKSNQAGNYTMGPAPYGAYRIKILIPRILGTRDRVHWSKPFELGVPELSMGAWEVIAPPIASAPMPQATPGVGQGQTGGRATPPPPPKGRKGKNNAKGKSSSEGIGFCTTALVWAADLIAAPETMAGSLFSFLAGATAGSAARKAADPETQDLFFVGEENTPPLNAGELTLAETVDVTVLVSPPPSMYAGSTITTTYTYNRITNFQTYVYTSGEVLSFDSYLPMTMNAVHTAGPDCGTLLITATANDAGGDPQTGPDVLIQAFLSDEASEFNLGEVLLRDDGQTPDISAGDGIYSANIPATCYPNGRMIYASASRNGFFPNQSPHSTGLVSMALDQLSAVPGDEVAKLTTALFQNSPNPFNPQTQISYTLASPGQVELQVFDIAGRVVRTLVTGRQTAGNHSLSWAGKDDQGQRLASGVYFYRLRAEGQEFSQKMTIVK